MSSIICSWEADERVRSMKGRENIKRKDVKISRKDSTCSLPAAFATHLPPSFYAVSWIDFPRSSTTYRFSYCFSSIVLAATFKRLQHFSFFLFYSYYSRYVLLLFYLSLFFLFLYFHFNSLHFYCWSLNLHIKRIKAFPFYLSLVYNIFILLVCHFWRSLDIVLLWCRYAHDYGQILLTIDNGTCISYGFLAEEGERWTKKRALSARRSWMVMIIANCSYLAWGA